MADGATTVAALKSCTKAGTACGGCVPLMTQVMNAELKKLGVAELPAVGETLQVTCMVEVVGVSQHQEKDGDACRSVELQITDMDLGQMSPQKSMEQRMYGG